MSPLHKRFPRELRNNLGKYLGMFLLLVVAISLTTGFLVAASSIERITDGMRDAYQTEDGRFTTNFEISEDATSAVEEVGCSVFENFSYDVDIEGAGISTSSVVRVHENREGFNEAAYAQGQAPQGDDEIALDRTFCDHAGITVGDSVRVDGRDLVVSGIMTLPDYAALFEKNTDFVMNALTFCVAVVDKPAFEELQDNAISYTYSFLFDNRNLSDAERADAESDIAQALADNDAVVTDLIDADANQGISYASEDVEGDQVMWEVLSLLIVVIMAFVFVVLTSSTIEAESAVIGTLLASGYRKRELLLHYAALPCFVGCMGALLGNILGYTLLSGPMQGLYYNSYSLPPYEAYFNVRVLLFTTVVPLVLLAGITFFGLARRLRLSPLQFLRHDIVKAGVGRNLHLPERLGFSARFGLRVFARNLSHFVTLFFGIAFASLLLLFSTCMMPTVTHYADTLRDDLVSEHQYTLKAPLEIDATDEEREAAQAAETLMLTEDIEALDPADLMELSQKAAAYDADANPINTLENSDEAVSQAEKIAVAQMEVLRAFGGDYETISVYGIDEDSRYFEAEVSDGRMAIGQGLAEKCGLEVGETMQLQDRYEDATYEVVVDAIVGSRSCTAVYMSRDVFNDLFDHDADYFNGYVSDQELSINERYLAADLTPADMDKIGAQMEDSMGDMVGMLMVVSVLIYLILMYLLTKTVIDRSARSISYMKVFGYRDGEVNKLYLRPITITVVASLILSLPLVIGSITMLLVAVFMKYSGNITVYTPPDQLGIVFLLGVVTYAVVAFLHIRRIRRVPLALALKEVE